MTEIKFTERSTRSFLRNGPIWTTGLQFSKGEIAQEIYIEVVTSQGKAATGYINFPIKEIPAVISALATFMLNVEEKL